mgnify:CR=1 FL=1
MQMKPIIPLLLLVAALSPLHLVAQSDSPVTSTASGLHHQGEVFEDFVAQYGWIFIADLSKADGLIDLQGVPAAVDGQPSFSAEEFDPIQFDPRDFAIEMNANPLLPTDFRVGDRGVLQFHSAQRCQDLYERHLARQAKGQ